MKTSKDFINQYQDHFNLEIHHILEEMIQEAQKEAIKAAIKMAVRKVMLKYQTQKEIDSQSILNCQDKLFKQIEQ